MAPNKPTILFLASWYPTPLNKSHGIFIRNHALALSKFCNVLVAYAYSGADATGEHIVKNKVNEQFEEWLIAYKKTSLNIPGIAGLVKYFHFKKAYRLLAGELVDQKINIKAIQLNVIFPAAIGLPVFKKRWPVPHTVLEHWSGYLPEDGNYKGFITKYFTEKTIAAASKIFYVSEKQKEAMEQHGLKGNYELVYNSVDTSVFNAKNAHAPHRPLLLHVSSLDDPQKNISGLISVIAGLQKTNTDFDVIFIGGDEQLIEHYTQRANELHLKNIVFAGKKTPVEISAYMQRSTALILFSNYENMPVVALEALACGLPVISTRTGYLDKMISPEFGRLVEINDEAALLKTLQQLLEGQLKFDPEKMTAYIAAHASMEVVGKQLYNFYKRLLEP